MLPKTEHPTFPKTLPLSGKTVRIRPMTIRDEKILLMVGDTMTDRLDHLKQVLQNCVVDDINFDELSFLDFQYLFITVRATSIDSVVSVTHLYNDKEYNVDINLSAPKYKNIEEFKKNTVVMFAEGKGLKFKSPTFSDIYKLPDDLDSTMDATNMIVRAIDSIFFGEDVYDRSNITELDMAELFDSLPAKTLSAINKVFAQLPYMYFEGTITLDDGETRSVEVTNFADFF